MKKRINPYRIWSVIISAGVCAPAMGEVLVEDTTYYLPDNKSQLYNGDYTIESETSCSLTVKGGDGSGKFINNGTAELKNLGSIFIGDSKNTWSDSGGGNNDSAGYGHGGVFSADSDSKGVFFTENFSVSIKNVAYDSSDWGPTESWSEVRGGAIYADNVVEFKSNGYVWLDCIGSQSIHDDNYCYRDFYGYGGAVYTHGLTISGTWNAVEITNCYIKQGVCTDAVGEGKGGALYTTEYIQIVDNGGNVCLNNNYIHTANEAWGGALHLNNTGTISGNGGHVQMNGNHAEAAPDMDYANREDDLSVNCHAYGGAVFITANADFSVSNNKGDVQFNNNYVSADYSGVTSQGDGSEHRDDPAVALGGAVYLDTGADFSITSNGETDNFIYGNIQFVGNKAQATGTDTTTAQGGAVYMAGDSTFTINGNKGEVLFEGNTAEVGGAVYVSAGATALIEENEGGVSICRNTAAEYGGAVYMAGNSTFTINGNKGEVLFDGNTAEVGGAVYVSAGAAVLMQGNKAGVSFSHNNAGRYGGALYAAGKVELNDNSFVSFADNSAEQGAAIYAESTAQVDICGNDSVTFTMTQEGNNPIYLNENAVLNLNNNGQVVFNTYTKPNHTALYAAAGAQVNMCGNVQVAVNECESSKAAVISCAGSLSIDANTGGVTVKDNAALGSDCGVIYLEGAAAAMSVSGNQGGVQISGNFALNGAGVIYADHADSVIRICNNTEVTVTENSVNGGAGAIHTAGSLYVCNNSGKVIFGNNSVYDEVTNTTVLNSINASQAYFSAAGGGSIELRDAISIGSNLHLNADADGVAQNGEIKFTGRYTDAYILTHAGNVLDRDASRFSSVEGTISLHAGSLTVESQAVLEAWKLIVDAGKDAVVSLSDGGILRVLGQVTMGEDTTLSAGLPDADMLRLTELAPAPASIDDLIRETDIAGVLQCGQLTLSTGSTYALYGGILDLGGAALNLEGTQNLTITGSNQAVQIGDEKVLLLFSGVTYCDASDAVLLYNGHSYTEENIIFDASRNVVYLTGIVPEPGTSVLTLTAFIGILLRRKRA